MELRHMRYFIVVAEELHFGRAAARLHIAQQPLSSQIKDLEEELGLRLFLRAENRIRLSAAGEVFLEQARITLQQSQKSIQLARKAAEGDVGRLRIGFCSSAVSRFLPSVLKRFRENHPDVIAELEETYEQIPLLEN